jgi:3-deoxy-D-manno-octulosonic-acid transferase
MPSTSWLYRAALGAGVALAPAVGVVRPRLRRSIEGRKDAGNHLLEWSRRNRDRDRPLVWFHASSVGEGLQAQSVLKALRRLRLDAQIVYTHFSPSAESFARQVGADAVDYLPYDFPADSDRLLRALEPDLLVFAKLDVWPELSTRAAGRGIEVALIAATVRPGSGRLRWPVRRLLQPGYHVISAAATVSPEDAQRLKRLGVIPGRIRVLGDPRFDSVMERVGRVRPDDPLLLLGRGAPTLVAGSTWPADEAVVLQAFRGVRQRHPNARLILVPHEPTPDHLSQVESRASGWGLPPPVRLSAVESAAALVLVDRVGVLAALYGAGTMAFVGGGFGRAGLHSVLEPAAWAVPVAFGPQWRNSRDAGLLLEADAAIALPHLRTGAAAKCLEAQWESWIVDERARQAQGERGRRVVERGLGASERSAAMLAELISARRPQKSPPEARSIQG